MVCIEQDELVVATTSREGTQESVKRQLPMSWGACIDGFVQEIDATLTVDAGV